MEQTSTTYLDVGFPIRTEMAFVLESDSGGNTAFIIGFSTEIVEFKEKKIRYLSGLGNAIYVAAFDMDDEEEGVSQKDCGELDTKEFLPRPIVSASSMVSLAGLPSGFSQMNLGGAHPPDYSSTPGRSKPMKSRTSSNVSIGLSIDSPRKVSKDEEHIKQQQQGGLEPEPDNIQPVLNEKDFPIERFAEGQHLSTMGIAPSAEETLPMKGPPDEESTLIPDELRPPNIGIPHATSSTMVTYYLPTWEPVAPFNFPVAEIPLKMDLIEDLTFSSFSDVSHLADGSNANVYLAKFRNEKVM